MPDTDILVSELNSASQINTTDLLLMTQPDGDAQTGYSSRKGTVLQVANKLLKDTEYTTDLPNFDNKSVFGALNEIHNGTYIYKENETPYQLRQTPITANRCLEKLIGVSCAFNQLVQNGNFADISGWSAVRGSITVSDNVCEYTISEVGATTNANRIENNINTASGHKYYVTYDIYSSYATSANFVFATSNKTATANVSANAWNSVSGIIASTSSTENIWLGLGQTGASIGDKVKVKNVMVIDFTACFGSEVADYLYNLENG